MAGSTVLHGPLHSLRSPRSYPRLSTMDPDFIMEAWLSLGLPAEPSFLLLCYATLGLCVWDQLIASLAADGTRAMNLTEHGQKRVEGEMDVEWAGPQMCYGGPKGLLGNEIPISL
ncbi:hypothetical protein G5714_017196 [Onychostoma macrolepis]|uniref:Uncharacterized protein n=1 Tax=Onychostoma macrolepis TaxID=369639 RepID=A0A7J6C5B6_9TELE|nr:hypothetical protein G5714_017196 [Onychostoma macrolepis]